MWFCPNRSNILEDPVGPHVEKWLNKDKAFGDQHVSDLKFINHL